MFRRKSFFSCPLSLSLSLLCLKTVYVVNFQVGNLLEYFSWLTWKTWKHSSSLHFFILVDRVQEAEREVSKMLLKSIEHHIQDAGKALLKNDEGKQNSYINNESRIFNL